MSLESVFRLSLIMNMIDNLTGPMAGVTSSVNVTVSKLQKANAALCNMAKTGAVMQEVGSQITGAVLSPAEVTFETRRACGERASRGVKYLGVVEYAARQFSDQWAGTTKADFIAAAYDIKSGIATLEDLRAQIQSDKDNLESQKSELETRQAELAEQRAEADKLVAAATAEARKLVAAARAEAEEIVKKAEAKAEDGSKNTMTEISLAGKQAVGRIKSEIASLLIAKATARGVKEAVVDPAFIKEMLVAVAKNWNGSDSGKVELQALLPEGERKKLDAAGEESAKELLAAGVEVGWSKEVKTGF